MSQAPVEYQVRFLLLIQSDPDYSDGTLKGSKWSSERLLRVGRWLKTWGHLLNSKSALIDPGDLPLVSVEPPDGSGILANQSPDLIRDPVLRKEYEDALGKNAEKVQRHRIRGDILQAEQLFGGPATRYIVEAYCKPPYNTSELDELLGKSSLDATTKSNILTAVKNRIGDRLTPVPRPSPPEASQPPPISWRTDTRLQAKVTMNLASPLVDDVIRELRTATGVDLTRSDTIQLSAPAMGSLSVRGVPAWQVMEQLAKSPRVEGNWEPAGTGYRIVSNGKQVRLPEQDDMPQPPRDADRRVFLLSVLGANLVILLGAAGVYWWARSRRTSSSQPPPPAIPPGSTGAKP
jgi:hypothetical protein